MMILPRSPLRAAAKASSQREAGKRSVMTREISSPVLTMAVMAYQVSNMFETWYAMTAMVSTGLDISRVITDRFPASRWEDAFAAARNGDRGKIIIDWSQE